jgi:hypothetical protein
MPLSTLVTNQVKDSSGTEVEFVRMNSVGRTVEFQQSPETPNLEHRIKFQHQEFGNGTSRRRRSNCRVDKTAAGANTEPVTCTGSLTLDIPIGNLASLTLAKDVLAELTSLVATLATNTFLYDGTGNGAVLLLNGTLE